jgi:hypothetical protein
MKKYLIALALAVSVVLPAVSLANVPGPDSPDHRLTPGAHFAVGTATICVPGYSARVRNVPESLKDRAYARYGIKRISYAYEVDHLVSLELGGSNAITNVWPEHYDGQWGARSKDRLENKLHALVCAGQLSLASAQRQEAGNWIAAYRRYVTTATPITPPSAPSTPPPAAPVTPPVVSPPPVTPPPVTAPPVGATALCNDGTYSYSAHHQGSCSYHGGVAVFYA